MKCHCCYPTCPKDAEFVVYDLGDNDPYTSDTHACARCLGALMGHNVSGNLNGKDEWLVLPIETVGP